MLNTHTPHLCCSLHFQQEIDGALSLSLSPNAFSAHLTNCIVTSIKCRFDFAYYSWQTGREGGKGKEEIPSPKFPHFIVLQTRNIATAGVQELRNKKIEV